MVMDPDVWGGGGGVWGRGVGGSNTYISVYVCILMYANVHVYSVRAFLPSACMTVLLVSLVFAYDRVSNISSLHVHWH